MFRWIQDGKLPAIRVGRSYRIPLEPYLKIKASLVHTEDPTAPQIHTLMENWLHHLAHGPRPYVPGTVNDYRYNFLRYLKMLGGGSSIQTVINREAVKTVLEKIPVKQYCFRYHLMSAVISFTKYLADQKLLQQDTVEELIALRPKRVQAPRRTAIEKDQVSQLLSAIWTLKGSNSAYERELNYAICMTLLKSGLRSKELCDLIVGDIDLEKRTMLVRMGKGNKPRLLGITQELARVLRNYIPLRPKSSSSALFLSAQGTPLLPNYVSRRITRLARASGLDVTAHGLRRSFCTNALLDGKPLAIVSRAMGHNQLSTTNQYLLLNEQQVVSAMVNW